MDLSLSEPNECGDNQFSWAWCIDWAIQMQKRMAVKVSTSTDFVVIICNWYAKWTDDMQPRSPFPVCQFCYAFLCQF